MGGPGACTEALPSCGHPPQSPPSPQALEKATLCFIFVEQASFLSYMQTNRVLACPSMGIRGSLPQNRICPPSLPGPPVLLCRPVRVAPPRPWLWGSSRLGLELGCGSLWILRSPCASRGARRLLDVEPTHCYPYFTDEETEVGRGEVTSPGHKPSPPAPRLGSRVLTLDGTVISHPQMRSC